MKNKQSLNLIFIALSSSALFLIFKYPAICTKASGEALTLCATSLIPVLFPYMVFTKLLTEVVICRMQKAPKVLLYLLSLVSGIPNGAIITKRLYSSGALSRDDAEKFLIISSNASLSFCAFFLGRRVLEDAHLGLICLLTSVVSSLIASLFFSEKTGEKQSKKVVTEEKISFTKTVRETALNMLYICAFVTVFMCIGQCAAALLKEFLKITNTHEALILGLFEMSSGVEKISVLFLPRRLMIGTLIINFGGLCALMQSAFVLEETDLRVSRLVLSKIIAAVISIPVLALLITALNFFAK